MIVGLTGTLGAGKGEVSHYLVNAKRLKHYSMRDLLIEEIQKRNLPVNRDTMTQVANELTAAHTPSYLAQLLFEKAKKEGENAVIESIRRPAEAEYLNQQGDFYLIAVDADPRLRYERIQTRNSETDAISFETFLQQEQREMNSTNPHEQNIQGVIQQAHFVIQNNKTLEELHYQIDDVFEKLSH